MKKLITKSEIIGIIFSLILAPAVYIAGFLIISTISFSFSHSYYLKSVFTQFIPAIFSIFISVIFQSKRYRPINSLFAFITTTIAILFFHFSNRDFFESSYLVENLVNLMIAISGILIGILISNILFRINNTISKKDGNYIEHNEFEKSHFIRFFTALFIPVVYIIVIISSLFPIAYAITFVLWTITTWVASSSVILICYFVIIFSVLGTFITFYMILIKPGTAKCNAIQLTNSSDNQLKKIVLEIAEQCNEVPPDNIILHAEPTLLITNRNLKLYKGKVKGRTLIIGLPLIRGLSIIELKAFLAHELAYLSGSDNIYKRVSNSLLSIMSYLLTFRQKVIEQESKEYKKREKEHTLSARDIRNRGNLSFLFLLFNISQFPSRIILRNLFVAFNLINSRMDLMHITENDKKAASLYGREKLVSAIKKVELHKELFHELTFNYSVNKPNELYKRYLSRFVKFKEKRAETLKKLAKKDHTNNIPGFTLANRINNIPDYQINLLDDVNQLDEYFQQEEATLAKFYISDKGLAIK